MQKVIAKVRFILTQLQQAIKGEVVMTEELQETLYAVYDAKVRRLFSISKSASRRILNPGSTTDCFSPTPGCSHLLFMAMAFLNRQCNLPTASSIVRQKLLQGKLSPCAMPTLKRITTPKLLTIRATLTSTDQRESKREDGAIVVPTYPPR